LVQVTKIYYLIAVLILYDFLGYRLESVV